MEWTWVHTAAMVLLNNLVLWIWKPWTNAYAGEKGKNLARKEDLDKILAEVRAVTITQREIEAKISGETWERQWRLDQKRDIYSRVLRAIGDYMIWLADVTEDARFQTGMTTTKECHSIAEEFHSAYAVSALFLSDESMTILDKIRSKFFYHSSLDVKEDQWGDRADKTYRDLAEAKKELVASARRDLAG